MEIRRGIIFVLSIAALLTLSVLPCYAANKDANDKEDIWTEDERKGPGPGRRRFELTDEEIDRIMKGLKESNPAKAKELAKLREKDPEKFRAELRTHGREEFGKIIRERIEAWRQKRRAEFLEWLQKNYAKQAKELDKLKTKDPDLYNKKFDLTWNKYRSIFDAERRNPELGKVLKEDLELRKRRDELLGKLKATKDAKKKKQLAAQLEEVVAARFDLIVRRKQIAYEHLLKRLEELQKRIKESRAEIREWRSDKLKAENVKKRIQDLTEGIPKFDWD